MNCDPMDRFHADQSGMIVYSCVGRRFWLPAHAVIGIARATAAALVPSALPAYEGLVEQDGVLAPQIDLSHAMGGPARTGAYSVLLQSATGLLCIRVDGVSLIPAGHDHNTPPGSFNVSTLQLDDMNPLAPDDAPLPGLTEINSLCTDLGLIAAAPPLDLQTKKAAQASLQPFEALLVRNGTSLFALPALDIARVERRQGTAPLRKGEAAERLVAIDGELLAGWSLAAWLNGAPDRVSGDDTDEDWVLVVRVGSRLAALTVSDIQQLISVLPQHLRHVQHRSGTLTFIQTPEHGLIEVLRPELFDDSLSHIKRPSNDGSEPMLQAWHRDTERRLTERGPLAIRFGSLSCVFPETAIAEICGEITPDQISPRRTAGAYPLFDPAKVLGLPELDTWPSRVLRLARPGRQPIALLAPRIGPIATHPTWHPLPLMPPLFHDFFRRVRLDGPTVEFSISNTVLSRPPSPEIAGLLKTAMRGWISTRPVHAGEL